jgi:hypothetical protein
MSKSQTLLNPSNLKPKTIFAPSASQKALRALSPIEATRWSLLRSDYCSFVASEAAKFKKGLVKYPNTLTCYNKTGATLAEYLDIYSEKKVPQFLTKLESLGLLVRLYYQDRKSTNLRRYLVVLDYELADYQSFLSQCAERSLEQAIKSKTKGGGLAGKTLRRISKYIEDESIVERIANLDAARDNYKEPLEVIEQESNEVCDDYDPWYPDAINHLKNKELDDDEW